MYEPRPRELSRRKLLTTAAAAGAFAASGVIGYSIAMVDDDEAGGTAHGDAPSQGFEDGPEPQGEVTEARDASLPPLGPSPLDLTYRMQDTTLDIAAGVRYNAWTYESLLPGPVLHVKQGDAINFTLVNDATSGHSIDFHSARTPWDQSYITILPGDSLSFNWTAEFPGVYMYHCGTAPVIHHIANGMYGAVVVDPETPLAPAREYVLVQSELYAKPGENGTWDADMDKMLAVRPDIVAFNGVAFQYQHIPLTADPGEKIRLYMMNAGPTLFSAFHVIGAIFDVVYVDGNPRNPLYGVSTYTVAPGQGCKFELTIPEAGLYPFVTHSFAYTGLGAVGLISVGGVTGTAQH
jgi:nitrite reductase (NO-forming)